MDVNLINDEARPRRNDKKKKRVPIFLYRQLI